MNDLQQLLARREHETAPSVLLALKEGLAADPAASGAAADLHRLLRAFFVLDADASARSFRSAFKRHPDTAQQLLALLEADGESQVAELMRSLIEARPRPSGLFQKGLREVAAQPGLAGGVKAALQGFAQAAFATRGSSAEIELSLVWGAVEEGLLDRVAQHSGLLAFAHGASHRAATARAHALDALARHGDAGSMLLELVAARRPRVLAKHSEWDIGHEGAPAAEVEIEVRHRLNAACRDVAQRLDQLASGAGSQAATAPLRALYGAADGGELFVPVSHEPHEPGLLLFTTQEWDAEREHVLRWLAIGADPDDAADDPDGGLPAWAQTLVPIAALPGDASRWVVPIEGPLAGAVMLSNDDVPEGHARYPSVTHFVAALRSRPHEVLANGGYASYLAADRPQHLLYPEGWREDV